ncbi:MBL fold metallo-hydrolase [Savagea faecisuis]|uniref:MBL fold metallo-hydrolase n=1 Tax=Savagea faecisuis TaxID=1274803 RepID=A0ABW3GWR7_9BACL
MRERITSISIDTPFQVGPIHSFVLHGEVLSLIDAAPRTEVARAQIIEQLAAQQIELEQIEQLILTHHHPDHAGWTDLFPNAVVIGHRYTGEWMARSESFFNWHYSFFMRTLLSFGVPEHLLYWKKAVEGNFQYMAERPMDQFLQEGDYLPHHPDWLVYETLGHAQSHFIFVHEETRECLGGDMLLSGTLPNPLLEAPLEIGAERPKSLVQYRASLLKMRELGLSRVYAAHDEMIIDSPNELIDMRLAQIERRLERLLKHVTAQPKTVFQLTQEMYPTKYDKILGLTLSQVIGQLDLLVLRGDVTEHLNACGVYEYVRA